MPSGERSSVRAYERSLAGFLAEGSNSGGGLPSPSPLKRHRSRRRDLPVLPFGVTLSHSRKGGHGLPVDQPPSLISTRLDGADRRSWPQAAAILSPLRCRN